MLYRDCQLDHGRRLFRYRSFLPLAFLPVLLAEALSGGPQAAEPGLVWSLFCLCVSLAGLGVRVAAIGSSAPGTSGRNTSQGQVADDLNTSGFYSLCRHPLYVGNFLLLLGPVLLVGSPWTLVLFVLAFWMVYGRIVLVEETYLEEKYGDGYRDYASGTAVFLPRFANWSPPGRRFSTRRILRREYRAPLAVTLIFCLLIWAAGHAASPLALPAFWRWLLVGCVVQFFVFDLVVKRTRWLHD